MSLDAESRRAVIEYREPQTRELVEKLKKLIKI